MLNIFNKNFKFITEHQIVQGTKLLMLDNEIIEVTRIDPILGYIYSWDGRINIDKVKKVL